VRFARVKLENWRNFLGAEVSLQKRVFLVGPNASGKSNFLDVFRFLRDIADPQGGFQWAVAPKRGGVSQIRSLHARRYSHITIEVEVHDDNNGPWVYRIEFTQDKQRTPLLTRELVKRDDVTLLERPDKDDRKDERRLTQTHLEQLNANKEFRALQDFFSKVRYLHIVPQLVREPERSVGKTRDPYGGDFLEQLASTQKKTLDSRLRRISEALRVAVPQLKDLELHRDQKGVPHLRGLYKHWRPKAGWQAEDQFSDGTLRLVGLLWVLLDGTQPLLLEEPELSLHPEVVRYIPSVMARLGRKVGRQVLVSTHSADLLADEGIAANEVLILEATPEDTKIKLASEDEQILALLEGGIPMSEAVLPRAAPRDAKQLVLFGE
jgi:predicted ATPase